MLARAIRAALLDGRVYREMSDDPQYMFNALAVVLAASAAFGLGIRNLPIVTFEESPPIMVVLLAVSTRMTGWLLWSAVTYLIGTRLLRGNAGFRRILRNLGIAFGPGVLAIFFEVPAAGPGIFTFSLLWMFAAGLVAVREAQGYGWPRALIASAIGWYLAFLILPGVMIPISGPDIASP